MIGSIAGEILAKYPPQIVINVGGLGYEVDVPMSIFFGLPPVGSLIKLVTHFEVKEDSQKLYGFTTYDERAAFRELLKVTGIGCRSALSIMSSMTVAELASAVSSQDHAKFQKAPGIGKKTAERLVLDLRGKLEKLSATQMTTATADVDRQSIKDSLLSLGYSEKESEMALKQVPIGSSVVEGIRVALKALSK